MIDRRLAWASLALLMCLGVASCAGKKNAQQDIPPGTAAAGRATTPELAIESRALDLLKAASARMAAARTMSFKATVSYEFPSKYGPPIVYAMRYDVSLRRPDNLTVMIPGDGPASEFYYDGKEMFAFSPAENLVAVASAPPTLDAALKMAFETADIHFPFSDLILENPYAALAEGTKLAFLVGQSEVVGGVKTDVVAWSSDDVFLQMWIGVDDKLPRKFRAIYLDDPLRLRHDMDLTQWRIDAPAARGPFIPEKVKAAPRMGFAKPAVPRSAIAPNQK